MTFSEIHTAILNGKTVHWSSEGYTVVMRGNDLFIVYDVGGRMEGEFSYLPPIFKGTLFSENQFYCS